MKRGTKNRYSIALGAASAGALLVASVGFAQPDEGGAWPASPPSGERQAVDQLKQTVADLLVVLLTDFPTDALLVGLVPELPYLHPPATADALLERAVAHNPDDAMLNRLVAEMAFGKGDYAKAISHFEKTSELSRETWEIRNRIAESQLALGRYQQVVDALEARIEHPAFPGRSHYLLGQAHSQLANHVRAVECFEAALRANPRDVRVAYALGNAYLRLKRPEEARPYLDAVRERQAARDRGALEAAAARVQPELRRAAVPVPWKLGELANALSALCAHGVKLYRASRRADRAEQLLADGQAAFRNAIELAPEQPGAHREFARLYLLTGGGPSEAIELAERAVALGPSAQNHLVLGHAYRAGGEDRKAIAALRKAAELEPAWLAPKNDLAWILATHEDAEIRQPAEAVRLAERAAALTGYRNPNVLHTLAAAYASSGQFASAAKLARDALALARAAHDDALAAEIGEQLRRYENDEPYRGVE